MSYLGSSATPIPVAFSGVRTQSFSGTGSASLFTLNRQVNAVTDIEVVVNNVQQSPFDGSYSIVNNGLGLQFSENPSAGTNNIYVVYRDQPLGSLYDTGAVRKTGDTMTGKLDVTTSGVVTSLTTTSAFSAGYFNVAEILAPNQTGGGLSLNIGKSNTTKNLGKVVFNYSGSGSNSNKLSFGFYDADGLLNVDAAGRVTMPYQPAFDAYHSAGSTGNLINWGTNFNRGNHWNGTTGLFTAPVAGEYLFIATGGANGAWYYDLFLNGSRVRRAESGGPNYSWLVNSIVIAMNSGDTIGIYSGNTSIAFDSTQGGFSGCLLG